MSSNAVDIDKLRADATLQGTKVRELKKSGGSAAEIQEAVNKLKQLKLAVEEATAKESKNETFNRKAFEELLIRKMYVVPSFEIYGGVAGFYDFGPASCALKSNLLALWKRHFILEDQLLEIECTNLMPEVVLQTSGHVEKFTDLMVKDAKTGECYRADKLLEDHIENLLKHNPSMTEDEQEKHRLNATKAESFSPEELDAVLKEYGVKAPSSGGELTAPIPFNLMFQCSIGPEGSQIGYLRPETAQGIFLNFRRLLEFNAGRLPFGAAQIGNAFRNEISPRGGLLRVREFQQAEIEYFVNPKDKSHPKFHLVASKELVLFPKSNQLSDGKTIIMRADDAVAKGIIANESLAYFLTRTMDFVEKIGVDLKRVRFRQHLDTEMAHYATDCWDLEIKMTSGWIECAGHADRSCYDLQVHAKKSKVEMVGTHKFDEPRMMEIVEMKLNKGKMGREFKKEMASVNEAMEDIRMDKEKAKQFEKSLEENGECVLGPLCTGKSYTITRDMVSFKFVTKKVSEEKFVPSVIEPSFGIGRILNAVFEHSFSIREEDENRTMMSFKPLIAPIKASILPLSSTPVFKPFIQELESLLNEAGLSRKTDTSSVAIGRKYARADELGIPFNLTVDFETVDTRTVTLRERDSCSQIRLPIDDVASVLTNLISEKLSWSVVSQKYPVVSNETNEGKSPESSTIVEDTGITRFRRPAKPIDGSTITSTETPKVESRVTDEVVSPPAAPARSISIEAVNECKSKIIEKGDEIRKLKTEGADKAVIKEHVDQLLALKKEYKDLSGEEYVAPNQGSSKKNKKKK